MNLSSFHYFHFTAVLAIAFSITDKSDAQQGCSDNAPPFRPFFQRHDRHRDHDHHHHHDFHPNPIFSEPTYEPPTCSVEPVPVPFEPRTFPVFKAIPVTPRLTLPSPVSDNDFYEHGRPDPNKVILGRLLFFDKILSGNRNISCATCHHPLAATGDDLSLSTGEGANGLGRDRNLGIGGNAIKERMPRNALPLFNLGAKEFSKMFHDGRAEVLGKGFRNPAGNQLPKGLENILAVQAMFPVTSAAEMAGEKHDNQVAAAADADQFTKAWDLLAQRLRDNRDYVELFQRAFPRKIRSAKDIGFADAANAIAAYEAVAFRTDNSPFDEYLRGNRHAIHGAAQRGMELFYGRAKCADCHSGKFQTDHKFHAIAMPQIGPGKGDGYKSHDDFGRARVTKNAGDRYKFRTPSLRNVEITGPWGHSGAYSNLEAMIRHHLDPAAMLANYQPSQLQMPGRADLNQIDLQIHHHQSSRAALLKANELKPLYLSEQEISDLVAFLGSLTDPRAMNLQGEIPTSVPSQLPVSDYVMFAEPGSQSIPFSSSSRL